MMHDYGDTQRLNSRRFLCAASVPLMLVVVSVGWGAPTELVPPLLDRGERFGKYISVNRDTAIVASVGKAFVFAMKDAEWAHTKTLDLDSGPAMTISSLAMDRDHCAVGVASDALAGESSGAVYVFRRTGMGWDLHSILRAENAAAGARFGSAVSISGDLCIVGAEGEDESERNVGAAYAFRLEGDTWHPEAKLVAPDATFDSFFGYAVSATGQLCVVTRWQSDVDYRRNELPPIYVFQRSKGGIWFTQAQVKPANVLWKGAFGGFFPVRALNGRMIAGGYRVDSKAVALIFRLDGELWREEARLVSHPEHRTAFGAAVDLTAGLAIVGAPLSSPHGAAYVFRYDEGTWRRMATLRQKGIAANSSWFGQAVATNGQSVFVGAPQTNEKRGAVYVWPIDALAVPRELARMEIEAMNVDEVMRSLKKRAAAIAYECGDEAAQQRLRRELEQLMDRAREIRQSAN